MTDTYYHLPPDLADDIDHYEQDVQRFIAGDLPAGLLKAKRVPRGVYEQRQDGTYMVRVRVAGGTLTGVQTGALAGLATEYGNGLLHVTTRQDVQLHDIAIGDTPAIMRRLMDVGLTSKGGGGNTVRNITACPYAGICPHECFDVTPCAHAVTEYLIPLVGSYNLPRKYKIAFSGCAADCALAQVVDLGFIAETRDGRPGFRVVAGGGMGASSRVADGLVDWMPVSEIIRASEAVRRLFDKHGDRTNRQRARLRFVFERLGVDRFRDDFVEQMRIVTEEGVPEWQAEPALNEGRTEPGSDAPALEVVDGIRCFAQRQEGFVAVPLHMPMGFVSADDFAACGELALQFSEEKGPRTTRSQNMLLRTIERSRLPDLASAAGNLSIDVIAPDPLERVVACAGSSTCRLGLCLARGAARACADALADAPITSETLADMEVYINGCPNACGQQPIGQIGLSGAAQREDDRLVPSYRVTLGGRCGAEGARLGLPVGQVPARALPSFMRRLAEDFQAGRQEDETFTAYFDRQGTAHFESIVVEHQALPAYAEDPQFYRDFGTDEDFSLAGRGAGECGAGVFEVIQEDLTAARKADTPFEILLPTVRALLITRGVDAREAGAVLREFEKHFLDTGLVEEDFRDLLSRARGFTQGWQQAFDGQEAVVDRLLDKVEQLYGTLDANLQFHPSTDSTPPESEAAPAAAAEETDAPATGMAELDLSGVACPMNFVKAKLRLESMNVGESLAIVLDDGAPIQNVPASFKSEDQAIESTVDLGDGQWKVVVRKEH
jgi:sulfite reductase (ferredoxin)